MPNNLTSPLELLKSHTGCNKPEDLDTVTKRAETLAAEFEKRAEAMRDANAYLDPAFESMRQTFTNELNSMLNSVRQSAQAGELLKDLARHIKADLKDYERSVRSVGEEFAALKDIYGLVAKAEAKGDQKALELATKAYQKAANNAEKTFAEAGAVSRKTLEWMKGRANVATQDHSLSAKRMLGAAKKIEASIKEERGVVAKAASELEWASKMKA